MTVLLYSDLTYKIRGAAFTVYNSLGFGHKENVYQNALSKEFDILRILYRKEASLSVHYRNQKVGAYRPDFIVDNKIIVELKAVEFIPKSFEQQLIHYLKSTDFQLGLLINFGNKNIYIKRIIWTNNQRKSVINP